MAALFHWTARSDLISLGIESVFLVGIYPPTVVFGHIIESGYRAIGKVVPIRINRLPQAWLNRFPLRASRGRIL